MPMTRTVAASLAFVTLAPAITDAQQTNDPVGDPVRGKAVFRTVGGCMHCHGWPADGKTGVHLRAPGGSNLRETDSGTEELIEVVKCGIPGTAMPYHHRTAYRDKSCFGKVLSEFEEGSEPIRGKSVREKDIANVVAYLQAHVIGLGKPTYEECAEFFDNPAARACDSLK